MKAHPYIMKANIYSDLKPKYIELYSRKPPSIAPKIFEKKATDKDDVFFNSFENANPEKKIGKVKITVISSLLAYSGKFSVLIKVNKNPHSKDMNSSP
tara:strand:+ start:192 stop:485 length:294 start_codon:yes stop_codon:yes gene_type:complete